MIASRLVAALVVMVATPPGPALGAVVLKFAHNNIPGHPTHEAAVRFAELVQSRTSGEVQVRVFPSSQLGRMNETWTGVKIGTIEIGGGTPLGTIADLLPELSLFDAPYMFSDIEHFRRVSRGPIGRELGKRLVEKAGIRILYYQYFGLRHLTTSNTPVRRPDDLRGLKIRAVPTPILMATVEGMGARPSPMDFAELYQGLRSGIVDGQDNPVTSIHSAKFHEVQKYLVLTGHIHAVSAAVVNERVYQALSPAARTAIEQASIDAANLGDDLALKQEVELLGELRKAGMAVIGPEQGLDLEAFRTRVRGHVYPKFEAQWTRTLMEQVQALR